VVYYYLLMDSPCLGHIQSSILGDEPSILQAEPSIGMDFLMDKMISVLARSCVVYCGPFGLWPQIVRIANCLSKGRSTKFLCALNMCTMNHPP
jgi:hypothetical protein